MAIDLTKGKPIERSGELSEDEIKALRDFSLSQVIRPDKLVGFWLSGDRNYG